MPYIMPRLIIKFTEVAGLFNDLSTLAISPPIQAVLFADSVGQLNLFKVDNEHPEVSFLGALWGEIWYESRSKHGYVWQSSAANSDFEPKYEKFNSLGFSGRPVTFYSMLLRFRWPFWSNLRPILCLLGNAFDC